MADYNTPEHRMNYYDGLLLHEDDFRVEQDYHMVRRRRLNKSLGVGVIKGGLEVIKVDASTIRVTEGTAIDKDGKECVQVMGPFDITKQFTADTKIYVTIKHAEVEDYEDPNNPGRYMRIKEHPIIDAKPDTPEAGEVVLASFVADSNGNVPGSVNDKFENERQYAGFDIADDSITTDHVEDAAITMDKLDSNVTDGLIRAFVVFGGGPGGGGVLTEFNVSSVSQPAVGEYTINWAIATHPLGPYFCTSHGGHYIKIESSTASSMTVVVTNVDGNATDDTVSIMVASVL